MARTRATTPVTLDLSDLVLEGFLDADEQPHREARARMSAVVSADGPVIVIVEGSSDARWLRRALEIAAPDVSHCFEFLDFLEYNPPGGVDRVVSLTKGMAAAGVVNRIVAVLDNDTAGRVAASQLVDLELPERFAVVNLPHVPFASNYPTMGPEGSRTSDVNGRAASMEFMFGDQVLRDDDNSLFPVRWHSFIEKAGEYQGRLAGKHKRIVGDRIKASLESPESQQISDQVLEGCLKLSEMLIAAANPPERVPASEASALSALWRRDPLVELQLQK